MNDVNAIYNGGLANKPGFFGGATAEIIAAIANTGSWNTDSAGSVVSTEPWVNRGGRSTNGFNAGTFTVVRNTGGTDANNGHRTILSGY